MDKELWSVFLDTGDPVGYLLYRAGEEKKRQGKKPEGKRTDKPAETAAGSARV